MMIARVKNSLIYRLTPNNMIKNIGASYSEPNLDWSKRIYDICSIKNCLICDNNTCFLC